METALLMGVLAAEMELELEGLELVRVTLVLRLKEELEPEAELGLELRPELGLELRPELVLIVELELKLPAVELRPTLPVELRDNEVPVKVELAADELAAVEMTADEFQ